MLIKSSQGNKADNKISLAVTQTKADAPEECTPAHTNCDPNAICTITGQGYKCKCPEGYLDSSPSLPAEPGRLCVQCGFDSLGLFECEKILVNSDCDTDSGNKECVKPVQTERMRGE